MLRCQFLCHVLKTLFFIKVALKLSYFCKKMQNFGTLGASPPDPQDSPPPPPPPPLRMSGYAPGCAFERRSPLEFGEKSAPVLVKTFFFGLHLNSGEKSVPFLAKTFFWF